MKLVLSRKGFDSSSGGGPSPIVDGQPISLPIPASGRSNTSYSDIGLGTLVEQATRGKMLGSNLCHFDPMFEDGRCAFGQTGAAQSHLHNKGVDIGDVFLFFGLFSESTRSDPHHRIFGYMRVEEMVHLGSKPSLTQQPRGFSIQHPHTIGEWHRNNHLYIGSGDTSNHSDSQLRLSELNGPISTWRVPSWLRRAGLSYHSKAERWKGDHVVKVVGRGQEFVTDITDAEDAQVWLSTTIAAIRA